MIFLQDPQFFLRAHRVCLLFLLHKYLLFLVCLLLIYFQTVQKLLLPLHSVSHHSIYPSAQKLNLKALRELTLNFDLLTDLLQDLHSYQQLMHLPEYFEVPLSIQGLQFFVINYFFQVV